ncbi:MAG: hypothetical protein QOC81_3406 [Thermoanaerobaculia bacterium]|jgi:hypothetical protein|nr:hypothetical protein [Thermoanaerobaculia bacterium]
MKMTEFRSTQPLTDDDLAAIRANVMTTISSRNGRRWMPLVLRFAIAAAIVIALGITFNARRQPQTPLVATKPHTVAPMKETSVAPAVSPVVSRPETAQPQTIATVGEGRTLSPTTRAVGLESPTYENRTSTPQPVARAVFRPKHRPPQNPDYQTIRLEFRTPDPDVRIIWIASQTPTTPTGGKS